MEAARCPMAARSPVTVVVSREMAAVPARTVEEWTVMGEHRMAVVQTAAQPATRVFRAASSMELRVPRT